MENLYERLYEDNISGKVSDEWFMQLSHKYEVERMELKAKISALHREISELDGISQCYGWTITLIGAAFLIHCPPQILSLVSTLCCNPYNKGIPVYSPTHSGYTLGRYLSWKNVFSPFFGAVPFVRLFVGRLRLVSGGACRYIRSLCLWERCAPWYAGAHRSKLCYLGFQLSLG